MCQHLPPRAQNKIPRSGGWICSGRICSGRWPCGRGLSATSGAVRTGRGRRRMRPQRRRRGERGEEWVETRERVRARTSASLFPGWTPQRSSSSACHVN
jgi:hypothetical protein